MISGESVMTRSPIRRALWQVARVGSRRSGLRNHDALRREFGVTGVVHMSNDWIIPYAGAAVTATIVAAGYSLLSWWFGG